jgi:hypothetical protein
MDAFGATVVVGLACLVLAAIVALVRPFDQWRSVAIRLSGFGLILVLASLVLRALMTSSAGFL